MERFRFGMQAGRNGKKITVNGFLAIFQHDPQNCHIEIAGPNGGVRAGVIIDKATAQRAGRALLEWGMIDAALYCDDCAQERGWPYPLNKRTYGICPLCNEGERELNTADKVIA